jgi:hypothetical protein
MATKGANTTKSINEGKRVTDRELSSQIDKAAKVFSDEKKVKTSIPKSYSRFIGETLPLRINGVGIVLPVDGSTHEIPESFANQLRDYLNNLTT